MNLPKSVCIDATASHTRTFALRFVSLHVFKTPCNDWVDIHYFQRFIFLLLHSVRWRAIDTIATHTRQTHTLVKLVINVKPSKWHELHVNERTRNLFYRQRFHRLLLLFHVFSFICQLGQRRRPFQRTTATYNDSTQRPTDERQRKKNG